MTTPYRGGQELPLAPARRARPRPSEHPAPPSDYDDAEVARGQAAAVLGALGRLQLRLDVLSREQADGLAGVADRLERLERLLAARGQNGADDSGTSPEPGLDPAPGT